MAASDGKPLPSRIDINATCYRWTNYDTPFWALPNTQPARWHAIGDPATQYMSLSPDGAWAELVRAENLRTELEVAHVQMPLWEVRIEVANIADYSTFEKVESAGFSAKAVVDDDHRACQEEAKRLRENGFAGVVAPSAALPGAQVLALFGPKRLVDWDSSAQLASAVPARQTVTGSPPEGLTKVVRYRGSVHAGLREFEQATS